jgi:O-acetyl-ADP-ribose deacetylase (regulator of RNase III)
MPLHLSLLHPNPDMIAAFRHRFSGLPNIHLHQTTLEHLPPHDAFVTAGNSYGIMTAGIDAAVVALLGKQIMLNVQSHIQTHFRGEQPVGTACILPTGHPAIRFLVHAPTMRVPTSIDRTDKIYTATWAALLAVHAHNAAAPQPIQTLAFPAMGTGFGQVPYDEAARQMALAWKHYLEPPTTLDWDTVIARHKALSYDGDKRVISGA